MAGHAFRRGFGFSIVSDNPARESSVACRRFLGDGVAALGNGGYWDFGTLAPHTSQVQPWRLRLHLRPWLVFGGLGRVHWLRRTSRHDKRRISPSLRPFHCI